MVSDLRRSLSPSVTPHTQQCHSFDAQALRARSATHLLDLAISQEDLELSSTIRVYDVNLEVLRSNDFLIIRFSSSAASLFFSRKRTNLYQVISSTNLLPPRDVLWNWPSRSMNNLPVHLSARSVISSLWYDVATPGLWNTVPTGSRSH